MRDLYRESFFGVYRFPAEVNQKESRKELIMGKKAMIIAVLFCLAALVNAGTVIDSNIGDGAPNHWTKAGSPYHLDGQIYVLPGNTLTIDAGVVVASFVPQQGSLAVCRGADIYVNGTAEEPVIMTSAEDVATWDGSVVTRDGDDFVDSITTMGDPKTGTWREGVNEWGNLTVMGDALISASHYNGDPVVVKIDDDGEAGGTVTEQTNTKVPDGGNQKVMEGLTAGFEGDPKVLYGGDNDDDDSGSISYLSLRYGGKVIGLANELNGLSLGGIGRETDIHHVEIMNNVDDGIEIWGGTVQLEYVNIWNIGDDSFDIDEGWRGCARYGLIVQGYSTDASQGSGVGDNCIEHDGAEDSDAQPVTTARISNFTIIGQPEDGDGATAWRDNARVQHQRDIIMDCGEKVVRPDGDDGDGANGYGYNGTLTWAQTWETPAGTHSAVNIGSADPAVLYDQYICQDSGMLSEITDTIFYNNAEYADADAVGVTINGDDNPVIGNIVTDTMPIQQLDRAEQVVKGGKVMERVTFINPCPAGDALPSFSDSYHGGFEPDHNWLASWTAVDAYGMTDTSMNAPEGDLTDDGQVDLADFSVISDNWLAGK